MLVSQCQVLPCGVVGWVARRVVWLVVLEGFVWLISEDDVSIMFRLASFVNLLRVRFVWIVGCRVFLGGWRESFTESLILAQDERWRRALHMQVER